MTTIEIPLELLTSLASPARQAVNPRRSLCNSPQFIGSWLWDAELDSGVKHGKGETAQAKRESARAVSALAEQAQVLKRLVDEMKTA